MFPLFSAWPNWCRSGWVIRVYIKVWNYSGWNYIIECRCKRVLSVAYSKWISVSLLSFVRSFVRRFAGSFLSSSTCTKHNFHLDRCFAHRCMHACSLAHPDTALLFHQKNYDNYYIISLVLCSRTARAAHPFLYSPFFPSTSLSLPLCGSTIVPSCVVCTNIHVCVNVRNASNDMCTLQPLPECTTRGLLIQFYVI